MDIPTVHKTPSGTGVEMHVHEWVAWSVVFSGSWSKLGVCRKCCKLSKFLPMPMLILLLHNN